MPALVREGDLAEILRHSGDAVELKDFRWSQQAHGTSKLGDHLVAYLRGGSTHSQVLAMSVGVLLFQIFVGFSHCVQAEMSAP